jgi:FlaA1/EpsC-like NDP-sugar epimerase
VRDVIVAYRRAFVVAVHMALWTAALSGAFLLRFEFRVPEPYWAPFPTWLGLLVVASAVTYSWAGLFHGLWRYSGARDLVALFRAQTAATALFAAVVTLAGPRGLPRSIFIIDWLATIMAVGGLRFGIRIVREVAARSARAEAGVGRRRVLVVGAGDAGEMLMREIVRTHRHRYEPVGFADDNPVKIGARIHGVPVLGPIAAVPDLVARERIDEVVIAIPSVTGRELRRIVESCEVRGAQTRMVPAVDRLIDGRVTVSQLHAVRIEDLLGREPVVLDDAAISACVRGRTVLVTGAGGSIGSELCRQLARFAPARLVLVEQAENALYHAHRDLATRLPAAAVVPVIADICDSRRLRAVFERERPHVVFHAAAHKHVPMMEWNPGEALKNNVFGTKKVADLAAAYGVDKFVMISTDKAVNPTSVMGASKRAAEVYVQALSQRARTQFVTVRFGNVLGSEGSVVPLFREQIARGGPVTVTHPEMRRYFMTIPEACQLVLQAGAMGAGGEIFVLDMGEPVRIVDLARDLIRLSGLVPGEDIEIQFTGVRPGEKLFEELSMSDEHADKTVHPKIYVGRFKPYPWAEVERHFAALHQLTDAADPAAIRAGLAALIAEYRPSDTAPALPPAPVRAPAAPGVALGGAAS